MNNIWTQIGKKGAFGCLSTILFWKTRINKSLEFMVVDALSARENSLQVKFINIWYPV